jgi:hypothetical protein
MAAPSHKRHEIAAAIQGYLGQHPDAKDAVEGIHRWWLPGDWQVDIDDVQAALIELQEQRLVRRHKNADQHVLFSLMAVSSKLKVGK